MDHFSPSLFAILSAMKEAGEERQLSPRVSEELLLRWKDAPLEDRELWLDRAERFFKATRSPETERGSMGAWARGR